jgi:hypothetical protein
MTHPAWPLLDLRLRVANIELRRPTQDQRYRLTREGWRSRPRPKVEVEGLEACLELFGVAPSI